MPDKEKNPTHEISSKETFSKQGVNNKSSKPPKADNSK